METKLTATFNAGKNSKFNASHRKESKCYFKEYAGIAINKTYNNLYPAVTIRTYQVSDAGNVYACIWINGNEIHTNGSGSAGGYGYDKKSAAVQEAINNAGFTLSENIAGRGSILIRAAVIAIGEAIGCPIEYIHNSHA
jgi:hypothetical protein